MKISSLTTKLVEAYSHKGLGFTKFYSPEDTEMFMRMARKVADAISPGIILDIGTGSAIPLIHAISQRHFGIGIDKDKIAFKVAATNAKIAHSKNLCIAKADVKQVYGSFDMIMSNPPFIPSEGVKDEALEVLGDGTSFIRDIFRQFKDDTNHFVIHFASIANPLHVFEIANKNGFALANVELGVAQFGKYSSEKHRLANLLKCRSKGESIFYTTKMNNRPIHFLMAITCHFVRKEKKRSNLVNMDNLYSILVRFGNSGLDDLVSENNYDQSIQIGTYSDILPSRQVL